MNTKQAIKYLEEKGYKITKPDLIEIKELGIKIKYEKWTKSYKELLNNIPKGFRLMKISEFFKLAELDLLDQITDEKDIWIYLEQLPNDKKNKLGRCCYVTKYSSLSSGVSSLLDSDGDGRVVWVKK